jgi:hypothetical protein
MKTVETSPITAAASPTASFRALINSTWGKVVALVFLYSWYPLQYMYFATVDDPDIWWHLRTGEWIIQNHAIPRVDVFSYTGMGRPWVAYSWLFEVVLYLFTMRWDLIGIVIYKTVMCLAVTAALFHLLRGITGSFWSAFGLTLAGVATMARILSPRPGMLTILFFVVILDILIRAQRTGKTAALWILPLLFAVWANWHVQFVYGLFVLALFCAEAWANRMFKLRADESAIAPARLSIILLVSAAATFLNPFGIGVYRVLWDFSRQPELAKLVQETRAMDFKHWINQLVVVLASCALVALFRARPFRPLFAILLLWAAVSAFRVERDVWVLVTISCIVIAAAIAKPQEQEVAPLPREYQYATGLAIAVLMFIGVQVIAPNSKQLLARLARVLPMGSVAYIHEHHPAGPIFNDFNWGGFLIYAVPDMPVSIDGRTNIHGAREIQRSWDTWELKPGWDTDPNLVNANIILGAPYRELTQRLMHDPQYRVVFNDGVSVLIIRNR